MVDIRYEEVSYAELYGNVGNIDMCNEDVEDISCEEVVGSEDMYYDGLDMGYGDVMGSEAMYDQSLD
jgi:hypothetical protein